MLGEREKMEEEKEQGEGNTEDGGEGTVAPESSCLTGNAESSKDFIPFSNAHRMSTG